MKAAIDVGLVEQRNFTMNQHWSCRSQNLCLESAMKVEQHSGNKEPMR